MTPTGRHGLPAASTNGGASCISELLPPVMLCAPILANWCTPVRPPTMAQSPTCTWPPSCTELARMVLLPIWQSCAMCT
ncbi:Uncharacterised protein [Bordetella pertussis]|nr:Uncharacterised protein [Bordetella pertussis]